MEDEDIFSGLDESPATCEQAEKIAQNLDQIILDQGFTRQQVLLNGPNSGFYFLTLLNPSWEREIQEKLGQEFCSYSMMLRRLLLGSNSDENGFLVRWLTNQQPFQARDYKQEPLRVQVKQTPTRSEFYRAIEFEKIVGECLDEAERLVYGEVAEKTEGNPELVFEIFKEGRILENLEHKLERGRKLVESFPRYIADNMYKQLCEKMYQLFPSAPKDQSKSFVENVNKIGCYANALLRREPQLIKEYIAQQAAAERSSVTEECLKHLDSLLAYSTKNHRLDEEGVIQWFSQESRPDFVESKHKDPIEVLFKSSLNVRSNFVDDIEEYLDDIKDKLIGLQQILAGGPITDPDAGRVSTLQNCGSYPNIEYSNETIERLRPIVEKLEHLLYGFPDIGGLATNSRMRKKGEVEYEVRELPKDPLDVTFGNDAGCCIFVPKEGKKLANGRSVPLYLLDNSIRLFSIYQINGKEQRMGLVLAFETTDAKDRKILACNTLELSRFGIVGGKNTTKAISDYVEDWLIGYTQEYGYDGAVMGSQKYNTSMNYSQRTGDIVQETLTFSGKFKGFTSNIFWRDDEGKLKTTYNSCYWLWKKE